jgi:hypothetical protein
MNSALKATTKSIPSFLLKLSSVTNAGVHSCDTQMLFQNQRYSTNQPVNSRSPQYTTPSKQRAHSPDKMQGLTGKRQAPQPPLALVTTLKPMLKEFQLLPDMAKPMGPHTKLRQAPLPPLPSTKKRQAPQPPLSPTKIRPSSELIAKLEQTIKADKQSPDDAAWYARHNTASITNLEQAIKEDKQSPDGAAWYARHNSPAQQEIHEKLRMALNDFHQDPEMAREKWIPVKKS